MASQTLTTRAAIVLHDGLTGKLSAMSRAVSGFHNQIAAAHSRMGGMLGVAGVGFGLQQALQVADKFNTSAFGVAVANIPENLAKVGGSVREAVKLSIDDMTKMEATAMRLSRQLKFSPTSVMEITEQLAKAGLSFEKLEETAKSAVTLFKTDPETSGKKVADFLHTLSVIHKPNEGEGFGQFIKRQSDMVLAAAATTKLGVGSIMEGMKQFQTLGAGLGMKSEQMLPLLMIMAQRGFGASESGTALRSMFVRLSKRTAEGSAVLAKLGIDLTDKKYAGGASLVDPMRAVGNLNRALGGLGLGSVTGKLAASIKTLIGKGEKDGLTVEQVSQQVQALLGKHFKIRDSKTLGELGRVTTGAIGTPGGKLNVIKLLEDLAAKIPDDDKLFGALENVAKASGMSDADVASLFRGEHAARMKGLLDGIRKGEHSQYQQLLERMQGQGLDTVEALWGKSAKGNVESMKAAFERLNIVIANSPGIQRFVNWIERMADAISKADPMLIDLAARLALVGVVSGPLLLAAAALAKVGSVAWMAAKAVGALNAALFVMGARGLAAAGVAAAARGGLFGAIAGGAMMAGSRVLRLLGFLGRLTGIGLAIGAVWSVFENWKSITAWFEKLGKSEGGKALLESWGKFWTSLQGLGGDVMNGIGKLLDLLGFKSDATGVTKVLDQIIDLLTNLGAAAEKAVEWVRKLVNGDFGGALGGTWLDGLLERFNRTFGWMAPKPAVPPGTYDPYAPKQGPEAWDWDGKPRRAPLDRFDFLPPGMAPAFAGIENSNREVGTKVDALGGRVDASASAIVTAINAQSAAIGSAVANAVAGAIPRGAKGPAAAPAPTLADGSGMGR